MTTEQTDQGLYSPVSALQLSQLEIEWVPRDQVKPNKYNPNRMTTQDRELLRRSILEDGWTQPIVTLLDGTIVDGEQRWTTAGTKITPEEIQAIIDVLEDRINKGYPESQSILSRLREGKARLETAVAAGKPSTLASLTNGLVPVTRVDFGDDAHKMLSTIRHNRARGTHTIDAMAGITQDLLRLGLDVDELEHRLGMDDEEIRRLLQAAEGQAAVLFDNSPIEFTPERQIQSIAEVDHDTAAALELQRSATANQAAQVYQDELAERKRVIQAELNARVAEKEQAGEVLTQLDKQSLQRQIEKEIPAAAKAPPPEVRKFIAAVRPDEFDQIKRVLGEWWAVGLVEACKLLEEKDLVGELAQRVAVQKGLL